MKAWSGTYRTYCCSDLLLRAETRFLGQAVAATKVAPARTVALVAVAVAGEHHLLPGQRKQHYLIGCLDSAETASIVIVPVLALAASTDAQRIGPEAAAALRVQRFHTSYSVEAFASIAVAVARDTKMKGDWVAPYCLVRWAVIGHIGMLAPCSFLLISLQAEPIVPGSYPVEFCSVMHSESAALKSCSERTRQAEDC